jgi:peptidoglycan hydrolase-like protein with peptidoglycan-binding domain
VQTSVEISQPPLGEILISRPETEEIQQRLNVGNYDNSTGSFVGSVMWTALL